MTGRGQPAGLSELLAMGLRDIADYFDPAGPSRLMAAAVDPDNNVRRAELDAAAARRRRTQLDRIATERGVPDHPKIRRVVLAERLENPSLAVQAVEHALAWRRASAAPGGRPWPIVLILAGAEGRGKSSACGRCIARWRGPAIHTSADDVSRLSAFAPELTMLGQAPAVAFDEMGVEEWRGAGPRLGNLLSKRLDARAGPLFTLGATNLTLAEFKARYVDGRLESRLKQQEAAGCSWWEEAAGEDLRTLAGAP